MGALHWLALDESERSPLTPREEDGASFSAAAAAPNGLSDCFRGCSDPPSPFWRVLCLLPLAITVIHTSSATAAGAAAPLPASPLPSSSPELLELLTVAEALNPTEATQAPPPPFACSTESSRATLAWVEEAAAAASSSSSPREVSSETAAAASLSSAALCERSFFFLLAFFFLALSASLFNASSSSMSSKAAASARSRAARSDSSAASRRFASAPLMLGAVFSVTCVSCLPFCLAFFRLLGPAKDHAQVGSSVRQLDTSAARQRSTAAQQRNTARSASRQGGSAMQLVEECSTLRGRRRGRGRGQRVWEAFRHAPG